MDSMVKDHEWRPEMKLNVKAFAVTCALFWGFGLLLLTWWILLFEGPSGEATLIGRVYRGYSLSIRGSFIGFLWATLDGLIGGAIFAWFHNTLVHRFSRGTAA